MVVVLVAAAAMPDMSCDFELSLSPCDDTDEDLVGAASRGDSDEVARRLDDGDDPDETDGSVSALRCAVRERHTDVVRLLLDDGAEATAADVAEATRAGDVESVRLMLDAGVEPDSGLLQVTAGGSFPEGEVDLLALVPSESASGEESAAIAALLLERGADPNGPFDGPTPLLQAVFNGRVLVAVQLLEHGADPNVGGVVDRELIRLAQLPVGNGELVPQPSGPTVANVPPIVAAAWQGNLEAASLLLDAGADPNLSADDAFTAIYAAAVLGNDAMVTVLLERGASPVPYVRPGVMTPAEAARAANHPGTADLVDAAS
jgi:ankyrin repeat protein